MRPDKARTGADPQQSATFDCEATPLGVRKTLANARLTWDALGASQAASESCELVLAEVLNNVVEHAHVGRINGRIELSTWAEDARIHCIVRDDGREMPMAEIPLTQQPNLSGALDSLPEGGFGWLLIRELTEALDYRRVGGWNVLKFYVEAKDLPQAKSA